MDTDDLTPLAYEMFSLAYDACEPLRADLGAGASDYKAEDEYLRSVKKYLKRILKHPKSYLEYWNLEEEIEVRAFSKSVIGIVAHVEKTLATPRSDRGRPPFESRQRRPNKSPEPTSTAVTPRAKKRKSK